MALLDCPVPVVDLRNLRDDTRRADYQPLLCIGLDAVIAAREMTGINISPWIYEEVNPFKVPPHYFTPGG